VCVCVCVCAIKAKCLLRLLALCGIAGAGCEAKSVLKVIHATTWAVDTPQFNLALMHQHVLGAQVTVHNALQ